MVRLAFRNLFQNKGRLVGSVGGVALAMLLILALDAIVTGMKRQLTAYIDHSRADVVVAQRGVRNMHMASSSLPSSVVSEVRRVPGVVAATPFLYVLNVVSAHGKQQLVYVIGVPRNAQMGTPWERGQGISVPRHGQAVIDSTAASSLGTTLGSPVTILGHPFRVAGITSGTSAILYSVAFIPLEDFARVRGSRNTVSYVWVKAAPGVASAALATRIERTVPGVTVQTRQEFAAQEQQVVNTMSTDVINIMNLVGLLIGLAVVALTVYTATLARRAEYGVLKALGVQNIQLYRVVLSQALISVALGLALGILFTFLLSALVPNLVAGLVPSISEGSLVKAAGMALVIAGVSAILPITQIAGLDPARVFKGARS